MDGISEPTESHEWPNRRWEDLQKFCILEEDFIVLLMGNNIAEIISQSNKTIIIHIERFLRAITRLFVLANLGAAARSKSPAVSHFFRLKDEELGTRTYEL